MANLISSIPTPACEPKWTLLGERCIRFFSYPLNYYDAQIVCQSHGGKLASIRSEAENIAISEIVGNSFPNWIGAFRDGQRDFVWSDDSDFNFSNWRPNQPDNYRNAEHCVHMVRFGLWNDVNCNNKYRFVCGRKVRNFVEN